MEHDQIRVKKGPHVSQQTDVKSVPVQLNTNTHQSSQMQHYRNIGNEALQRMMESGAIQAKLTIGQPNDKYEQEADRVADQVMRMPDSAIQRQSTCPECMEEEEELIQTKQTHNQTPTIAPNIETGIDSLRGGGQQLPESTRSFFEPRFGHNFSQVRIHNDSQANETASLVNAKAFTTGRDMFFGAGEYSPGTTAGRLLLAHELTHVLQQRNNGKWTRTIQLCPAILSTLGLLPSDNDEAISRRRSQLEDAFNRIDYAQVEPCYQRLRVERPESERSHASDPEAYNFYRYLHHETQNILLDILRRKIVGQRAVIAARSWRLSDDTNFNIPRGREGIKLNPRYWIVKYKLGWRDRPDTSPQIFTNQDGSEAVWPEVRRYLQTLSNRILLAVEVRINTSSATPEEAIIDAWNEDSASHYALDCMLAANLIELRGIYLTYSRYLTIPEFNSDYNSFMAAAYIGTDRSFIHTSLTSQPGIGMEEEVSANRFYLSGTDYQDEFWPGEWVSIDNRAYLTRAWRTENAIYLGGNRFFGHPIGEFNPQEYCRYLRRHTTGFLCEDCIFPATNEEMLQNLYVTRTARHRPFRALRSTSLTR